MNGKSDLYNNEMIDEQGLWSAAFSQFVYYVKVILYFKSYSFYTYKTEHICTYCS